jgi:hypothetical protein
MMGGKMSRSKGCRGEREACEALADVWPGLSRTYHQSHKGSTAPDIDGPGVPVHIEVKRQESINVHAAMAQAEKACTTFDEYGDIHSWARPPVILHKRNRGKWLVTIRACDLARLVRR